MDVDREALRTYLRVFGWVLLLAALLPYDFYGSDPVWPWIGIMDATWADGLAIGLPFLGGVLFLFLGRVRLGKVALAGCILVALLLAWAVRWWGTLTAHPLAVYESLTEGLPPLFDRAFFLLTLGIIFLGAGMRLGASGFLEPTENRPPTADPWWLARVLTGIGIVLVTFFYFLPYRGAIPLFRLALGILELSSSVNTASGIALAAGFALSLGPLVFALVSLRRLLVRPPDHGGVLTAMVLVFLPMLCFLVGLRSLTFQASYTFLHVRGAALNAALLVGGSLALSALIRGLWYEVPWAFGRLTPADRLLVKVLSGEDPPGALRREMARLHPLVRPFVRRRLALWTAAIQQIPEVAATTSPAELSGVLQVLLERRQEEEPDAVTGGRVADPPRWMQGNRLSWYLLLAALLFAVPPLLAVQRPEVLFTFSDRNDLPVFQRIFSEELPQVVSELSHRRAGLDGLDSAHVLSASLAEAEPACSGIQEALTDLLRYGRRGRDRIHTIWRARDRLNLLLHRCGVPYLLRSRLRPRGRSSGGRDLFYLLAYRVEGSRLYRLQDSACAYAVIHLRRVDSLNVVESYVGAVEEEDPFASILVDRVEEYLDQQLTYLSSRIDTIGENIRVGQASAGIPMESSDAVRELLIEGLSRHELHHQWLGLDPEPPAALWAWMHNYAEVTVREVAAEVGALLGELGYHPGYARMQIALLLGAIAENGIRGRHAAASVFVLSRLFGIELNFPVRWQAQGLGLATPLLSTLSDEELGRRIDDLHRELFGAPLPVFEYCPGPQSSHQNK